MLRQRIAELIEQHGSLRAAARVLMVDPGYLSRLASGEKDDPGEDLLRRMKLRRVVAYERTASTGADTARQGQDDHAGSPAPSEPVAWMWQHPETGMTGFVQHAPDDELRQWERMNRPRKIVSPLYPAPSAQSSKAALSDEEIDAMGVRYYGAAWGGNTDREFARAILSRAGIGESRREPLSEDAICEMRRAARDDPRCIDQHWFVLMARAVEQHHGITPQAGKESGNAI